MIHEENIAIVKSQVNSWDLSAFLSEVRSGSTGGGNDCSLLEGSNKVRIDMIILQLMTPRNLGMQDEVWNPMHFRRGMRNFPSGVYMPLRN